MTIRTGGQAPVDLARLRIDRQNFPFSASDIYRSGGASVDKRMMMFDWKYAGLLFAALMGAAGGLLPAIRAARIPIARALREI